jgi:hypothetical protein
VSDKEGAKDNEQEAAPQLRKQVKWYGGKNVKVTSAINKEKAGPPRSPGKKQRIQFKLAPNRG